MAKDSHQMYQPDLSFMNVPLRSMGDWANDVNSFVNLRKNMQTADASIAQRKAESQKSQVELNDAQLANIRNHYSNISQQTADLMKRDNLGYDDIYSRAKEINENAGGDERSLKQFLSGIPKEGTPTEYKAWLASAHGKALSAQAQIEKLYPNITQTDQGGNIVATATGNPNLAVEEPGTPTGPYMQKNLSPQVFANPITGQPAVMGGGGAIRNGNLNNRPAQVTMGNGGGGPPMTNGDAARDQAGMPRQAPEPTPLNAMAKPSGGLPTKPAAGTRQTEQRFDNPQASGINAPKGANPNVTSNAAPTANSVLGKVEPMRQGANESPANFNARVGTVQKNYTDAQNQLTDVNSERGYIPQIQQINRNILGLLKDSSVDTGAVNNALAGKTNQASLSPKEQELYKFLKQRIQAKIPKSDADAVNKTEAYGSFNLKKDALKDLTRQELTWATTQDLLAQGRLNNGQVGGSANNPNFGRVAAFDNAFTQFSRNPKLMDYIAVVGDNPDKIRVDSDDRQYLQKLFSGMSPEKRHQLELERKTVLNLVKGK
ncbi:hypothetical protein [Polynucleobacter asymbioticus]|uniref:hypothetical protein n=1 Tax=Polynucleobacter asymbioticus TaxID=576611 RepID=UPI0008F97432|nr:hypothetical protein [Polynucleobacter asymbioticus]